MIIPTVTFEAYISGSWVSLTSDVVRSANVSRGIIGQNATDRIAKEGTLTFYLNNSADNSAGLIGYYSLSHANKLSGWGRGVKVRVSFSHASYNSGAASVKFVGFINKIDVVPGIYRQRQVKVTCTDFLAELNDWEQIPQTTVIQNAPAYVAYQQVIDEMNIQPEGTNFVDEYVYLDGVTSGINCGDTADLQDLHGGDFTIEGWFKPDSAGELSNGYFFGKGSSSVGGWHCRFSGASNSIQLQADFATTDIQEAVSVSALDDGDWHKITLTYTNSDQKMRLYIDHVLQGTTAAGSGTANTDVGNNFYIGARFNGNQNFEGNIAWVALYSSVNDPTGEPLYSYDVQPPIDTTNGIALWRMTEGEGTTVVDFIGSNDGTLVNCTWTDNLNGLDFLTYAFHRSGEQSGSAYQEFNRIAMSVFDKIYVTGKGVLTAQNRTQGINEDTALFTLNDALTEITHTDDRSRAVDRIKTTTYPLNIGVGQADVVYELENPIRLNAGESKTITCKYVDQGSSRNVGLLNQITAWVADTHYKMGNLPDGTSNNLNANLGTSVTYGAGAAEVVLTNNGASTGYVNKINIVGDAVKFFNPNESITQVTAGKNNTINVEMPYQESETFALAANNMIANVYGSTTIQVNSARYWVNRNTTTFANFMDAEILKRIAITESLTGLSANESFIHQESWVLDPGGIVRCTYMLAPARDTSARFIVGTSRVGTGVVYFSGG